MNEQEQQYLSKLAEKFGTTTEYLWSVMLKQAPIAAAMQLTVTIIWSCACAYAVVYLKRKISNKDNEDDIASPFILGCVVAICIATAIIISIEIPDAITAIVNPEYWALSRILNVQN